LGVVLLMDEDKIVVLVLLQRNKTVDFEPWNIEEVFVFFIVHES
jgi:hypothetical protein